MAYLKSKHYKSYLIRENMFDTTKIESKVVAMTQVVEKTITPDKVTEMYDKVREQVEKDVIRSIVVQDNNLKGVAMELHQDFFRFQKKILYRFTLNNKEYLRTDFEVEENLKEEQIAEKLYEHYKNAVAENLIKESIRVIIKK